MVEIPQSKDSLLIVLLFLTKRTLGLTSCGNQYSGALAIADDELVR